MTSCLLDLKGLNLLKCVSSFCLQKRLMVSHNFQIIYLHIKYNLTFQVSLQRIVIAISCNFKLQWQSDCLKFKVFCLNHIPQVSLVLNSPRLQCLYKKALLEYFNLYKFIINWGFYWLIKGFNFNLKM